MKLRIPNLSVAATLALMPVAASAQNAPVMGGGTMGGMRGHEVDGGMMRAGQDREMGGQDHMRMMSHMMQMMQQRLSQTAERINSLKSELNITEAQMPAWNKFADAVLAASKSMQEAMESMQQEMMLQGPAAAPAAETQYPDFGAIKKTAGAEAATATGLPATLAHRVEMLKQRLRSLEAIKDALDPLYASLSDEQKKIADSLRISPMGLM